MAKKVFVSGCYDMLHSGHVAFFNEAAKYGDLYVGIGSDKTISELKARKTINSDQERLYMIKALKVVKDAWINSGGGILDFEEDLRAFKPDIFFVNEDGHSLAKEKLCSELAVEYVVSKRIPHSGLPIRSTTALRQECNIPYRIDLAGGWLDQPEVSKLCSGSVITINLEPDYEFNDRSGMATSSRKKAIELWQTSLPEGDPEKIARTLFCFENPPGTKYVSGSQDSIGIVFPGANKLSYNGDYWTSEIEKFNDKESLDWLEDCIKLIQLYPRKDNYDVLSGTNINALSAQKLSASSAKCWEAIKNKDIKRLGEAVTETFISQTEMFPNMVFGDIEEAINNYKDLVYGYKITGAGGGGYLILITDKEIDKSFSIRIRRSK